MYSSEEVLEAAIKYFGGDDVPAKIWMKKYALRDENDNLLEKTPDDTHRRIAREIARIEKKKFQNPLSEEEIFSHFKNFERHIPQGSPMFAIGNYHQYASASNCFTIDMSDSFGGICCADQELVQISKMRGGVGLTLDTLRPSGTPTRNSSKTSSGILPFMEQFSDSTRRVGQCIEENQRVLTKTGLKAIKNIVAGEEVWTQKGWIKVKNVFNNGVKDIYRTTSKRGYSVLTSKDHIFQILSPVGIIEKHLEDIDIEVDKAIILLGTDDLKIDNVALSNVEYEKRGNNQSNKLNTNISLPTCLTEEFAYYLGYTYGDGNVQLDRYNEPYNLSVVCDNDHQGIIIKISLLIRKVFGYDPKIHTYHKDDMYGDCTRIDINSKLLLSYLQHNGLLKQKHDKLIFPQLIKQSSPKIQLAFISGFFDADGSISKSNSRTSHSKGGYKITSVCEEFVLEIQTILLSLGIHSRIHAYQPKELNWKTKYTLSICGNYSQSKVIDLFTQSVKVQNNKIKSKRDNSLSPYHAKDLNINTAKYNYVPDNTQYMSLGTLTKVFNEQKRKINLSLQDNFQSISLVGKANTYDLELEEEHLFWCEGYYVHNSGRRGALMQMINIHHPESVIVNESEEKEIVVNPNMQHMGVSPIKTTTKYYDPNNLDFATIKYDRTRVTGANITIKITDAFMKAVQHGTEFIQQWPIDSENPKIVKFVDAQKAWDKIITAAHTTAEPGIAFIDNVHKESIGYCYKSFGFKELSSNPCGEIFIPPYDSCRLYALNLFGYIVDPFTENAYFDFVRFYDDAKLAIRIMDDIVDIEIELIDRILNKIANDPEDEEIKRTELNLWKKIKNKAEQGRRTGIGITALGDTLAALGIKYASDESLEVVDKIYKTLKFGCYRGSVDLAKELGAFPIFDYEKEKNNPFLNRIKDEELELADGLNLLGEKLYADMKKYGRRNIMILTTAPTGTISMLAKVGPYHNTSSGIEPAIFLEYTRKVKITHDSDLSVDSVDQSGDRWHHFKISHAGLRLWREITGKNKIEDSPYYKATANEINWQNRVKLQGIAQKHIDHSISSTINLPADVSVDEVKKIYEKAWEVGLKGITVYREGCRSGVLTQEDNTKFAKREKELPCQVYHVTAKGQPYFVLLGMMNNKPYEIFAGKNGFLDKKIAAGTIKKIKRGKYQLIYDNEVVIDSITDYDNDDEEALTRMTSANLRHGTPIQFVVQQLEKVDGDMHCLAKSMARALKKFVPENIKVTGDSCGSCNSENLVRSEGCIKCIDCGWSKC